MANDSKRVSELSIATSVSANDRFVVLTQPDSAANVQTITANNLGYSLANFVPIANSSQLGLIKIGAGLSIAANGEVTAPLPVANTTSYGVIKVGNNLSINATGYLSTTSGIGSYTFVDNNIQTANNFDSVLTTYEDLTTTPSIISYENRGKNLNDGYGWDGHGVWFAGNAGGNSYPVFSSMTFGTTDKVEVNFRYEANYTCPDPSVCVYLDGTTPQWNWGTDSSRIAGQVNCPTPHIYGQENEITNNTELMPNRVYRVRFVYDPNNTPHVTFEIYNTSDVLIDQLFLEETLPAGDYRIGFDADQDRSPIRTYIHDLVISVNDGGVIYENNLTSDYSGNISNWIFHSNGLTTPPSNQIKSTHDAPLFIGSYNRAIKIDKWEYFSQYAVKVSHEKAGEAIILSSTDGSNNQGTTLMRWHARDTVFPEQSNNFSAYSDVRTNRDGVRVVISDWSNYFGNGTYDYHWQYNKDGSVSFPYQTSSARTGSGNFLKIGNDGNQKIIGTNNGNTIYNTVSRLVISGGDGYGSGEGGDIYLWAGRSGPDGGSGGDIKVDAGNAYNGSEGGTIKIRGGNSDTGTGGFVEIWSGSGTTGAPITMSTWNGSGWKQWIFQANGALTFPDTTIQTTAYTGLEKPVTAVTTTTYTANSTEEIILCDPNAAGNNITVTLPVPTANGKIYTVKNINAGGYNVYVQSSDASSTIEVHGTGTLNTYDNVANSGNTVSWVYGAGAYRVIAYG